MNEQQIEGFITERERSEDPALLAVLLEVLDETDGCMLGAVQSLTADLHLAEQAGVDSEALKPLRKLLYRASNAQRVENTRIEDGKGDTFKVPADWLNVGQLVDRLLRRLRIPHRWQER